MFTKEWYIEAELIHARLDLKVANELTHPIHFEDMEHVKKVWGYLGTQIARAANFFPADASWENLDADTQEKLSRWSPRAKQRLESEFDERARLSEAWIWHILVDNLFSGTHILKLLSRSELWESYGKLQDAFHEAHNHNTDPMMRLKYQFWKQITFELLQPARAEDDIAQNTVPKGYATVREVVDLIQSEMGPVKENALDWVGKQAIQMYGMMHASAMDWRITLDHPPWTRQFFGFSFDSDIMTLTDPRFPKTSGAVELVTRPLLCVSGDVSGRNYDDGIKTISKMRVLMDRTRR